MWLNAERLSPYDYWQFWRNTDDADVGRFLLLFTDLDLSEISRLAALGGAEINEAKKTLATEATTLLHGADAAGHAAGTAQRVFEQGDDEGLATHFVSAADLPLHGQVYRLLAESGLAASNGEARRLIRGGGARLNDVAVEDEARMLTEADMQRGYAKLSVGKKHHRLIRLRA